MRKNTLLLVLIAIVLTLAAACSQKSATAPEKSNSVTMLCNDDGNGTGKTLSALKVTVTYFDPYFYTDQGYPGYYIGVPLTCKLTIKNTSDKCFKDLTVEGVHEYYENEICERWWFPYPMEANYAKGEDLPGDSGNTWTKVDICSHAEISLTWTYTSPIETCSGLDQTHVLITSSSEQVILNSPEAGIFCPPPPAKN
jgi:hypothetical protein